MTAYETDPILSRREHVEQWIGHRMPVLLLAVTSMINLQYWSDPHAPGLYWQWRTAFIAELAMLALVLYAWYRHENSASCDRCRTRFMLIDGPQEAGRRRRRLRADHWLTDNQVIAFRRLLRLEVPLRLLLLAACTAVLGILMRHHIQGIVLWCDAVAIANVAYTWMERWHEGLKPWCSGCKGWDEEGDFEPSPEPTLPLL